MQERALRPGVARTTASTSIHFGARILRDAGQGPRLALDPRLHLAAIDSVQNGRWSV